MARKIRYARASLPFYACVMTRFEDACAQNCAGRMISEL